MKACRGGGKLRNRDGLSSVALLLPDISKAGFASAGESKESYLDESGYKFNRMYFDDRTFDRLLMASINYKTTFEHHTG